MEKGTEKIGGIYEEAGVKIREIEDELKRLGRWKKETPPKEKFQNMGPFGMKTMSVEEWIQFVLIPRVKEIIKQKEKFPLSQFAVYATRNLDGDPDGARLLELIQGFDAIVNKHR